MDNAKVNVLLIEDNPDDAFLVQEMLAEAGEAFEVTHVERLSAGLERLTEDGVDVVLLDLGLPDSQGLATFVRLQAQAPGLPIVVTSGLDDKALAIRAVANGAQDYLVKGQVGGNLLARAIHYAIERKQAQEELWESKEHYRSLFDNVPLGLYRTAPDRQILDANPAMIELLGYPDRESLLAVNGTDLYVKAEDRRRWQAQMEREGMVRGFEAQVRRHDGAVIWVRDTARAIRDADGQVLHYEGSLEGITERVRAEEERALLLAEIREQARQVRQIMNTVPEGMLLLDAAGRVILTNPVAKDYLAVLVGRDAIPTYEPLTHLGNRPLAELLTSPPTRGLWHEVKAEGRIFELIARPIENDSEPERWVLVIRDITQEREIKESIQRQERLAAVGQLAAGIAHDFNNIMSIIILYAQMELRTPDLPPKLQERLETISEQSRRATDLINQILDFSRRAVLERRPIDLAPFLKEVTKLLGRTLPENIEIDLVYGSGEHTVNADPTRMQQVVTNLAVNARDATPEGGGLRIGLDRIQIEEGKRAPLPDMRPGEWVRVTVSDTGAGIPPDVLPRIFEPFFTTKERGEGTGLGLAQVHGIVAQHEGHIGVETQAGEGTTFSIYLPALVVPQPESPIMKTEGLVHGQGECILVVEDNAKLREALAATLELLDYRALAIVEQQGQEIALVLSDVVMPHMGGIALFHTLRQNHPGIPMVLLTGHDMEDELKELQAQGLSGWLLKPPSPAQLAQAVARVLRGEQ